MGIVDRGSWIDVADWIWMLWESRFRLIAIAMVLLKH
jgi:hypothetical protein